MHTYIREREIGERQAWGDGEDGEQREGVRTTKHTRETRERGRRKGKGQCRRTEPEALKFMVYLLIVGQHSRCVLPRKFDCSLPSAGSLQRWLELGPQAKVER